MSIANIANELKNMIAGVAAVSTKVYPIFETSDGIIFGYSTITALSTLSALCSTPGIRFAPNCLIINVSSAQAHNSASWLVNTGISSAPTFASISAFVV